MPRGWTRNQWRRNAIYPPDDHYEYNARVDGAAARGMSRAQQAAWLRRSQKWFILGGAWHAIKVLGVGSNGICGLWTKGVGGIRRNTPENAPRDIVVKQSRDRELAFEADVMVNLREQGQHTGSLDHVVKLYLSRVQGPGTGAHGILDSRPFPAGGAYNANMEVHRIYIEYCASGDLTGHSRDILLGQAVAPEEYIWRLMGCFAKALMLLEDGSETPWVPVLPRAGRAWVPIIHFDIKPGNVFVGERGPIHHRVPLMKLGDFGLSLEEPANQDPNDPNDNVADPNFAGWRQNTQWRASNRFLAPEQLYNDTAGHPNQPIGIKTNIWSVGTIMHALMAGGDYFQTDDHAGNGITQNVFGTNTTTHTIWPAAQHFQAYGDRIFGPQPYSLHLLELVTRCLAELPADRPTPHQLWDIVHPVLRGFDVLNSTTIMGRMELDVADPVVHLWPQPNVNYGVPLQAPHVRAQAGKHVWPVIITHWNYWPAAHGDGIHDLFFHMAPQTVYNLANWPVEWTLIP